MEAHNQNVRDEWPVEPSTVHRRRGEPALLQPGIEIRKCAIGFVIRRQEESRPDSKASEKANEKPKIKS
jgi:hypothetical protein